MAYLSTPAIRLSTGELVLAEELTNFLGILRRTHRAVAKVAKLLGRLTFEEVAPSSFPTFHFALAGDFEAFGCTPMSFLLRHLKSSLKERLKASCEIHILEQVLRPPGSPSKRNPPGTAEVEDSTAGFSLWKGFFGRFRPCRQLSRLPITVPLGCPKPVSSPLFRGKDHIDPVASLPGRFLLNLGALLELGGESLENIDTQIEVSHLTPTEHHCNQHLVSLAEEAPGPLNLDDKIMLPYLGAKLDFLSLVDWFFLVPVFLGLVVLELAEIHQLTSTRIRIRSNFH